jgi:ribokinase
MMAPPGILCLGNLSVDEIVRPDGSIHLEQAGGDALFGCLAARLFDPTAAFVAPVGDDAPPCILSILAASGMSTEGLPTRRARTLRNRFEYDTDDTRHAALISAQADFELLSPRPIDIPERLRGARAFMVLAMTLDAQTELVRWSRATRPGALLALDPQDEYIAGNHARILELVAALDVFLPSLDEVRALLGHDDARRAARSFAALGPSVVVIKMGEKGSFSFDARTGAEVWLPPCPARVVDPTGAGDAFCGGFLATLAAGLDLVEASVSGAVAASFAIESFGMSALMAATPVSASERLSTWKAQI